jgi:GNAT superfamily N-acetyltransferase
MRVLQVAPSADPELARTLIGIQHAAYALEATLIDDDRIPALHEDVDDLRSAALLWLAAFVDRRLVGAVGWSENDEELDVDRLVVAPEMHRRGVGSALIREVLQRAGIRRIVVSTGRDNAPATSMYEQLGFVHMEDEEVVPGLWVTRYSWTAG